MPRSRSILIVDDNRDFRQSVAELLERWGYTVAQGMDAREVIRKTLETKPDALILDLMMPGGSGHRVLEQLRERTETRRLPVILVTGWPHEIRSSDGLGPVELLTKPVAAETLRATLARLGLEPPTGEGEAKPLPAASSTGGVGPDGGAVSDDENGAEGAGVPSDRDTDAS